MKKTVFSVLVAVLVSLIDQFGLVLSTEAKALTPAGRVCVADATTAVDGFKKVLVF